MGFKNRSCFCILTKEFHSPLQAVLLTRPQRVEGVFSVGSSSLQTSLLASPLVNGAEKIADSFRVLATGCKYEQVAMHPDHHRMTIFMVVQILQPFLSCYSSKLLLNSCKSRITCNVP